MSESALGTSFWNNSSAVSFPSMTLIPSPIDSHYPQFVNP